MTIKKNFKKCTICNDYHWTNEQCAPEFFVYHEEYMGDEPKKIRAFSHEDAAIKYGKYYNQDDYPLINGDSIDVKVVDDKGNEMFFSVGAEPDIYYFANEIDSLDDPN